MKWETSTYSKVCAACFGGNIAEMRQYAEDYLAKGAGLVKPLGKPFRTIIKTQNRKKWWGKASVAINANIAAPTPDNAALEPFKLDRSSHSGYFEKVAEHLFLADILRYSVKAQKPLIEISKPEADVFGYDLVLTCNQVIRHIQVKSSISTGSVQHYDIQENLKNYPSACVVWIIIDGNLNVTYRFFGNNPGEPIPNLLKFPYARHSRPNSNGEKTMRKNIRRIKTNEFEKAINIEDLSLKLFGK